MKSESGAVTAEFALVLPTVTAVLAICLGALGIQTDRLRMVEQTVELARSAARGETVSVGTQFASGDLICVKLTKKEAFGIELTDSECARPVGK